jgi:hypothetical protein
MNSNLTKEIKSSINLVLLHYPCINRKNKLVATAAFPLDAQDIARSCATFGITNFFIVHPEKKQRDFLESVVNFWDLEKAWQKNESRSIALSRVKVASSLENIIELFNKPIVISTSATKKHNKILNFEDLANLSKETDKDILLLLGTGYGLHDSIFKKSDYQLAPLKGFEEYNHLSVRSAAAIMLYKINESLLAL